MPTKTLERPQAVIGALKSIQKVVKINIDVPFDMLVMEASVMYKNLINVIDRKDGLNLIRYSVKTGEWTTVAGIAAALKLDETELMLLVEIGESHPLKRKG